MSSTDWSTLNKNAEKRISRKTFTLPGKAVRGERELQILCPPTAAEKGFCIHVNLAPPSPIEQATCFTDVNIYLK